MGLVRLLPFIRRQLVIFARSSVPPSLPSGQKLAKALLKAGPDTLPCIIYPHGGPHGVHTTDFMPEIVALALEGCKY